MRKSCVEGDVVAVPLGADHHALGVVTRCYGRKTFLGEFFGPRYSGAIPTSEQFSFRQHEVDGLPNDGSAGHIFVEQRLIDVLAL